MKPASLLLLFLLPLTALAQWQEHSITKDVHVSKVFVTDDFDGDGDEDYLSHNPPSGEVFILENIGGGRIAEQVVSIHSLGNNILGGLGDLCYSMDLNGDALPDFIMSITDYSWTNHIIYFENQGNFQFTLMDTLISINTPVAHTIIVNDNNQDGFDDVVVSYREDLSPGVYEWNVITYTNQQNSFFLSQNVYANEEKVFLTDRDGDGDIDFFSDTLWYRNDMNTFVPITNQAVNFGSLFTLDFTYYGGIFLEDFNNDGSVDLVEFNSLNNGFAELIFTPGTSNYTFDWAAKDTSVVMSTSNLKVDDIDNNGIVEIYGHTQNSVSLFHSIVYEFDGVSTFTSSVLFSHIETDNTGTAVQGISDFNNDGINDIVVRSGTYSNFFYLAGLGNLQFSQHPVSFLNTNSICSDFQLIDFDNDQTMEMVATSQAAGIFSTYENESSTFVDQRVHWHKLEHGGHPRFLERIDFNNDGFQDLTLASSTVNQYRIEVVPNQNGLFYGTPVLVDDSIGLVYKVVTYDFNSDGLEDILVADRTPDPQGTSYYLRIYLYTNNGNNSFQKTTIMEQQEQLSYRIWDFVVGDIDGDADADLVVTIEGTNEAKLYRNTSNGFMANSIYIPAALQSNAAAQFLHLVDIDDDQDLDLFIRYGSMYLDYNTVYSYENPGNGIYGMDVFIDTSFTDRFHHGDYDNDGDLDLIFSDHQGNLNWYINAGVGISSSSPQDFVTNDFVYFDVGNINDDAYLDVAVMKPGELYMSWYEFTPSTVNVPAINLQEGITITPFPNPSSGVFYVENIPANTNVRLFDINARTVEIRTIIDNDKWKIEALDPQPGLYLLHLSTEDSAITKYLIFE